MSLLSPKIILFLGFSMTGILMLAWDREAFD